jgi:hypothetical protein
VESRAPVTGHVTSDGNQTAVAGEQLGMAEQEAGVGVDAEGGAGVPFGRAWIEAFGSIVNGVEIETLVGRRLDMQMVCADAGCIRPWRIEVDDGVITAVTATADPRARVALSHGVTVGWRLLGLSIRGHHRVDELTIEQRVRSSWRRFPIPPLDEGAIDLRSRPVAGAGLVWNERVMDSPLGTLYVRYVVGDGQIAVAHASTHPRVWPDVDGPTVDSDVAWRALLHARGGGDEPARAWRGRHDEILRVQLARRLESSGGRDAMGAARVAVLLDAMALIDGVRAALCSNPRWRDLWRPNASRAPR